MLFAMEPTVNAPITILVGLANHLVDFVVGKLLADRGHDVTELGGRDEPVVVAVEDLCVNRQQLA
jgi:hypothetical protein